MSSEREERDEPLLAHALDDLQQLPAEALGLYRARFYDRAVQNAVQAFINEVKNRAGRDDLDGQALFLHVFSEERAVLEFSRRQTVAQRDEHDGFRWMGVGMARGLRNVLTHDLSPRFGARTAFKWLVFIDAMWEQLDLAYMAENRDVELHGEEEDDTVD